MVQGVLIVLVSLSLAWGEWLLPSFDAQGSRFFPASPFNSTLGCAAGGADVILSWPTAADTQFIDQREVELAPIIDDKAIYTISSNNKNITALDPTRWTPLWTVDAAGNTSNVVISPLSLQGGLLYFMLGSIYGHTNTIVALRAADGARVWSTPSDTDYRLSPSTLVPLPDNSLLVVADHNRTSALLSIRPSNSSHFEDFIVWAHPIPHSIFTSYQIPPLLSEDKSSIFFFQDDTLFHLSSSGAALHQLSLAHSLPFGGRLFLRKDNVAVLVFLDNVGRDVYYHTIFLDVFRNATTSYPHLKALCLGPNQTIVFQNGTKLVLSAYDLSDKIWTQSLQSKVDIVGSVDGNGVLYVGAFASNDVGSYMSAYRLSDAKLYWNGPAHTPLQWSMSHFNGEYLVLLQSRGSMGKISTQNFCPPARADCTADGCVCKSTYFGPDCATFCDSALNCSGHGTCNSQGICECHPQYFNPDCSTFCDNTLNCSDYGTCDAQGHCQSFCSNSTFCNNRASLCVNATCTCQYSFWSFHTYNGERCQTESLNIPFLGTIGGVSFAVILLVILIVISACRRKDYDTLN